MDDRLQGVRVFELSGNSLQVSFASTATGDKLGLKRETDSGTLSFQNGQIRRARTEIGTLVSVTVEAVPDAFTSTLTLLIPEIHTLGADEEFSAVAIETVSRTSVAGAHQVIGAIQSYRVHELRGSAKAGGH